MQNGFGKTKLHTIKQETEQNKQPKRGTEQHLIQTDQMKGHSIINQNIWKW